MSSDSSDSEGPDRKSKRNLSGSDSGSQHGRRTPIQGPRTPKSPDSVHLRSVSNSPAKISSPSLGRSRSPSQSLSPFPETTVRSQQVKRPQSPEILDDDGRSNISSGSSILSHDSKADECTPEVEKLKSLSTKTQFKPVAHADDLSDVSDVDDSDGLADDSKSVHSEEPLSRQEPRKSPEVRRDRVERGQRDSIHMDDGEQLDFEAEDQPDVEREDGELEAPVTTHEKKTRSENEKSKDREDGEDKSGDEGEVKEDGAESLEEGEVTDEGDPKPEKPPICRFYSRGACTWGANCRFLHPGVTDKGNYSMFEVTRPMVAPPNGLGLYASEPRPYPIIPPVRVLPGPYGPAIRREEPMGVESAWERGLRQAKELMRKSSKRKETDMDFEEKKMNLSIGQDEMDKENDYYTRVASPLDDADGWAARISPKMDAEVRRPAVRVVERYEDIIPEPLSPTSYGRYEYRRGYDKLRDPDYMLRRDKKYYTEEELLARKAGRKMVREVIVQRVERERGERSKRTDAGRRPDEWLDPWMRSKSPGGRKGQSHRSRKVSYSSGSSSYSGSSSRSSSNSSYSSYSRSRSRSGSQSGSGSVSPSRPRRPRSPPAVLASRAAKLLDTKFKPLKATVAEKVPVERPMLMNPPAPSPRRIKEKPLSPSTAMRKVGLNPPAPVTTPKLRSLKHNNKNRTRKSRSSSSGSSGSSSDSTHSSYSSSSSSSRAGSPPARGAKKANESDERLATAALKVKGQEAMKVAGPKPQIKPTEGKRDKPGQPAISTGKKRPAEDPPAADPCETSPAKPSGGKKASSRREELLKQLKAVEDAIARKRSKI